MVLLLLVWFPTRIATRLTGITLQSSIEIASMSYK